MRGRVLDALAAGGLEDARAALAERAGEDGEGLADDPLLHRLWLWLVVRPRGPGHVTRVLERVRRDGASPEDRSPLHALDASLRASEALSRGDVPTLVAEAGRAADLDRGDEPFVALVVASVLQGAYRFTGRADLGERAVDACVRLGDRTDAPALAVQARALAGNVRMLQGRLHEADEHLAGALELARATEREELPECGMAWQFRGYVRYEWNRLEEARSELHRAVEVGEAVNARGVLSGAFRMLSVLEAAAGRPERARRWMARLEALMEGPLSERNREWLAATRTGLAVAAGDLRAGDEWIRRRGYRVRELASADPATILAALHEISILLQVLVTLGRLEDARELASAVGRATSARGRAWFAVRAAAVEAAALDGLGRADESERVLAAALADGRDEGFVRAYADVGAPLLPPLERLARRDPTSGHLGRVLAATRVRAEGSPARPQLTPRETEVLGLLARGLTNRQIAQRLGLSLATVKTHLHNLYGKLGVGSRTRAVARAEGLALL